MLTIETLEQGVKYVQSITLKTPERRQWRRSDVFIINFEHLSQLVLMFLMLILGADKCRLNPFPFFYAKI